MYQDCFGVNTQGAQQRIKVGIDILGGINKKNQDLPAKMQKVNVGLSKNEK